MRRSSTQMFSFKAIPHFQFDRSRNPTSWTTSHQAAKLADLRRPMVAGITS
jgi:hypothetical protein